MEFKTGELLAWFAFLTRLVGWEHLTTPSGKPCKAYNVTSFSSADEMRAC